MQENGRTLGQIASALHAQQVAAKMRLENPELYREVTRYNNKIVYFQYLVLGPIFISSTGVGLYLSAINESWVPVIVGFLGSAGICVVLFFIFTFFAFEEGRTPRELMDRFERDTYRKEQVMKKGAEAAHKKVNEAMFLGKGISIIAGNKSNIIIGDNIRSQYISIEAQDRELAAAIATLAGFVEDQNNSEAADVLDDLVDELIGGQKPSRVKAFWDALVKILPDIAKLSGAAATISKLF